MKTKSQYNGFQDVFALFVNENKIGFVLDIGCKNPEVGNNSILLLENGWNGVGIDIDDYSEDWKNFNNFSFFRMDASNCEQTKNIFSSLPKVIDFLSLDVDNYSFKSLQCINFDDLKFKCICIEHDYYIRGESLREPQRNLLESKGYTRVIQTAAEDWYVNYELISSNIIEILQKIPNHGELVDSEMPIIIEWLKII